MDHDGLMNSLADHLAGDNRMVWRDMQLGPAGSPRPDVYAVFRSYANPCPMAYECKVSRSDFLSDVTSGKWQSYLKYASGVVFACEGALIAKSDVPKHCGLITYKGTLDGAGLWRMAKRPVLNPVVVPQDALLKLLIDGVKREGPRYRAKYWAEHMADPKIREKFGDVVAKTVQDRMAVERDIEYSKHTVKLILDQANERADYIREQASKSVAPLRSELCEALAIPVESSIYEIKAAVVMVRESIRQHPDIAKWKSLTELIRRALDHAGYEEENVEAEQEV